MAPPRLNGFTERLVLTSLLGSSITGASPPSLSLCADGEEADAAAADNADAEEEEVD
jgi:hypothetical protein